jgi:GT2 family glycosyltransferase
MAVSSQHGHGAPTATVDFSVIIPTRDRRGHLAATLAALESQVDAPSHEIVVVDDGSRDRTFEWVAALHPTVRLVALRSSGRGPAAARNTGLAAARGRYAAFLGDDTVPTPLWLARHAARHAQEASPAAVAVLGRVAWHPRIRITPFLAYINDEGPQFGFSRIHDPDDVPFNLTYASNLSLPLALLEGAPFDEGFPDAAWEDVELGFRLSRRGVRLVYEPGALAWHDHETDIRRFAARQERVGRSAALLWRRHPDLGPFVGLVPGEPPRSPAVSKKWLLLLAARLLERTRLRTPGLWSRVLGAHYAAGLSRGWLDLRSSTPD